MVSSGDKCVLLIDLFVGDVLGWFVETSVWYVDELFLFIGRCVFFVSTCVLLINRCLWFVGRCIWFVSRCVLFVSTCVLLVGKCVLLVGKCVLFVCAHVLLVDSSSRSRWSSQSCSTVCAVVLSSSFNARNDGRSSGARRQQARITCKNKRFTI